VEITEVTNTFCDENTGADVCNQFMVSHVALIHTSGVNGPGLDYSHLRSHCRATEDGRGRKRHDGQREKEMYDSVDIMDLCIKHWRCTREGIDSLSLHGPSFSFGIFEMMP